MSRPPRYPFDFTDEELKQPSILPVITGYAGQQDIMKLQKDVKKLTKMVKELHQLATDVERRRLGLII